MNRLADALVEAVMFIAYRDYTEDSPIEEYEEEDIAALDEVKALLAAATDDERKALESAIERAVRRLPPDSELAPYYRAWMGNIFGADDEDETPPALEIEA